MTVNLSPGLAKIAPYLLATGQLFGPHSWRVPVFVAGWLSQVTLTAHTR